MELEYSDVPNTDKPIDLLPFKEPPYVRQYIVNSRMLTEKVLSCFNKKERLIEKHYTEQDNYILAKIGCKEPFYDTAKKHLEKSLVFQARNLCLSLINWKGNFFEIEFPSYLVSKDTSGAIDPKAQEESLDTSYFMNKFSFLVKSETDTIVNSNGRDIKGGDLNRLRPRTWLNGEIINFYTSLLATEEFQQAIHMYHKNPIPQADLLIFNTYFSMTMQHLEEPMKRVLELKATKEESLEDAAELAQLKLEVAEGFLAKIQYVFKKKKFDVTKHNYLFIPYHIRGNHWKVYAVKNLRKYYEELLGLCQADPDGFSSLDLKTIELKEILVIASIDSYNTNTTYHHYPNQLKYTLNYLILGTLNADYGLNIPVTKMLIKKENYHYFDLMVPHQTNGYDCGVATIENIEQAILHGDAFLDESDPDKSGWYNFDQLGWKREKIIEIIINLAKSVPFKVS